MGSWNDDHGVTTVLGWNTKHQGLTWIGIWWCVWCALVDSFFGIVASKYRAVVIFVPSFRQPLQQGMRVKAMIGSTEYILASADQSRQRHIGRAEGFDISAETRFRSELNRVWSQLSYLSRSLLKGRVDFWSSRKMGSKSRGSREWKC